MLGEPKKSVCQVSDTHSSLYSPLPYEENELPVITPSTAVAIVTTIFKIMLHLELGILLIICSSFKMQLVNIHPVKK